MTRIFAYNEQEVEGLVYRTENDIHNTYFSHWCSGMRSVGKENEINWEDCLDDWIVVNWAWEIKMSEKGYTLEQIKAILDNTSINIAFKKKDGTDREMYCTRNMNLIPEEFHPKSGIEGKKHPEHIVTVFDLNIKEWRSFDYNNFIGFC